ncbi:RagB/SusD family nutrient uptake outer membrane protein [Bacteroidales bacterium OttesenSCG-928-A17]|nr:RagB/SusD family nutrient uptake outer membrane protein [Bacteroidales bacterium OttesenSCG-928-A17]
MKKIIFKLILLCLPICSFTGCIDEILPTTYATEGQIGSSATGLESLSSGIVAFMYDYSYFGTLSSQEFGYPAMMIIRDAMTDCPYVSTNYNHFNSYWCSLSDMSSSSSRMRQPWRYYYRMILNTNNVIISVVNAGDPDETTKKIQQIYGNALVYRALCYLDLTRMYEYKKTGVSALDAEAEKSGVYGLTVPIVDEYFDNSTVNHPRVPFYQMYRFIMTDLNKAEKYLAGYNRSGKYYADESVVHAYKARLWLEIATRFQKNPEDLQTQLAHENDEDLAMYDKLGINSAKDCYQKAAEYAGKVIGKYTPLSESEWHSTTNGFNDMKVNSWVFAISISSSDAVYSRVDCFQSNCVTEYSRGYSRSQYHCYRMIDRKLYDKIDANDWRKVTWVDPADAGKKPTPEKYHTLLDETEWALRDAYVGFKYRPNNGDISDDYKTALQTDFPIIRVEEMYFIEAEAKTYTEGLSAGINALTSFMDTYRMKGGSYEITVDNVDEFIDNHLIAQKRIELWGEGLAFFDIKRRDISITRGYSGTNWLPANRYNSIYGYTPSWLNLYVPYEGEASINKAIVLNPNPLVKDSYGLWSE